ncbi:MAG TPA: methyltransferase domain-containing protein [Capillimicrobium sp.]|nr:methyltransferase domain-containing protein [Capillimicrobium sp.]
MDCFVCGAALRPAFEKDFGGAYGLDVVHYERCPSCGLVVSRTHYELADDAWGALNERYHDAYLGTEVNHDDPRWMDRLAAQAELLPALAGAGVVPAERPWLDYGAGDGKLADMVSERGPLTLKFDRYLPRGTDGFVDDGELAEGGYDLVLTTSVFEHVRSREPLDEVHRLVSEQGAMGLHTLVRGEIPDDPSWFYLLPVHCTFLTNRAMELLVEQWGYASSLYAVDARMWCFSRADEAELAGVAARLPGEIVTDRGFCAYWP